MDDTTEAGGDAVAFLPVTTSDATEAGGDTVLSRSEATEDATDRSGDTVAFRPELAGAGSGVGDPAVSALSPALRVSSLVRPIPKSHARL